MIATSFFLAKKPEDYCSLKDSKKYRSRNSIYNYWKVIHISKDLKEGNKVA